MSELSAEQTRLAQLWEEHMRHEFQTCSTEDTLATMIEDAYVNHVPVMTGGVCHAELRQFYATHFIPKMPPDMEMMPLSRTIGSDQLVDEMVVRFTHTVEEQSAGLSTAMQTEGGCRQSIERGPGLGEKIHSSAGRHCVTAPPREESGAKPIFEPANLPANGAVGDV